jgi:precorrin-8X/cobalt-precorrin-8 methylmutase
MSSTDPRAHPIELESYAILASRVDLTGWAPDARDVVARMIHATADESFASSARIGARAIQAAVDCLRAGGPVICDSTMVVAGIPAVARRVTVRCYLDRVPQAPSGGTRAAAAIALAGGEHSDGALWVVGNAPTALAALVGLWRSGQVRPAAVIGLPVGYVGAGEAKAALWDSPLGEVAITNAGPRGGSPVAAAAMNALARLAFPSARSAGA